VIDLPVPGTADREDPHPSRPLAGPSAQPAGGVPVAVFSATGRRRIAPQRDPTHPNGLVRRGLPRVAPRQPPWPVRPRCHRCPQRFFGLTALPRMWQRTLILGQLPGCPACGRRRPAQPKSKFLSLHPNPKTGCSFHGGLEQSILSKFVRLRESVTFQSHGNPITVVT
jgi:hypothetical protein